MPLLNYTTKVSAQKTVIEISEMLRKAKASAVLTEYDPEGNVGAVSFRIATAHGVLSFRLPANVDAVQKIIQRERAVAAWQRNREQAARIAWRIVKDWLAAQLALIDAGMADIQQVLLPYMQTPDGSTVYEQLKATHFRGFALPDKAS